MKKTVLCLCIAFICAFTVTAFGTESAEKSIDLNEYSIEELLALRDQIDDKLDELGYVCYSDIVRGDKGDHVKALQERLTELNYYTGSISGKFDNETQKAMKQFEKANGLEKDGIASVEDQVLLFSDEAIAKEGKVKEEIEPETEITVDVNIEGENVLDQILNALNW